MVDERSWHILCAANRELEERVREQAREIKELRAALRPENDS